MARLRIMVAAAVLLSAAQAWAQDAQFPFDNVRTLRSSYSSSVRPFNDAFPFSELAAPDLRSGSETYRTLCVRPCDGYYFPISQATGVMGLSADAERCTAACGGEARLFYHPNPGGDVADMLDFGGRSYASYPNAFKYRRMLVAGCQCRPQPWTEAELARHRSYSAGEARPDAAPAAADFAETKVPAAERMDHAEAEDFLARIAGVPTPSAESRTLPDAMPWDFGSRVPAHARSPYGR